MDHLANPVSTTGCDIIHRKGSQHVVPDFLSRYQAPKANIASVCSMETTPDFENIGRQQAMDKQIYSTKFQICQGLQITSPMYYTLRANLFVCQSILFKRYKGRDLVVIPEADVTDFVLGAHLDASSNHLSARQMIMKIKDFAHFYKLEEVLNDVVKRCGRCLASNLLPHSSERAPIQEKEKPTCPLEQWHMDFHGPVKVGENRPVYIFGATDAFSKYLVTGITNSKHAMPSFKVFLREVIYNYGVPISVCSDQGTEFADQGVEKLHKMMKIKRIRTTGYHPSSNGQIERIWQEINSYVRKNTLNFQDIEDLIQPTTFAVDSTVHSTIGYTPNYIHLGAHPQHYVSCI